MVRVGEWDKNTSIACTNQCFSESDLIFPRKYMLIVFHETVHVVLHGVRWISKNKISRIGGVNDEFLFLFVNSLLVFTAPDSKL